MRGRGLDAAAQHVRLERDPGRGRRAPPAISWGEVLFRALSYRGLYYSPLWTWWVLPAGLVVTVAVLGFTFLGVGLETRMNPRAAGRA